MAHVHSPATLGRIRVTNRRRRYLVLHPEYFDALEHELSDPLRYDRYVRQFQSSDERNADSQRKEKSDRLEADLWRSEAKLAKLAAQHGSQDQQEQIARNAPFASMPSRDRHGSTKAHSSEELISPGKDIADDQEDDDDGQMLSKETGLVRWRNYVASSFLQGHDSDFGYAGVDDCEEFDDLDVVDQDRQNDYFDSEEPSLAEDSVNSPRRGETGMQDF